MTHRQLRYSLAVLCAVATCAAIEAVPVATAAGETCTVTVVTTDGQTLTFTQEEPAGQPPSAITVPDNVPVQSASESCVPDTSGSTGGSGNPGKTGGSGSSGGSGKSGRSGVSTGSGSGVSRSTGSGVSGVSPGSGSSATVAIPIKRTPAVSQASTQQASSSKKASGTGGPVPTVGPTGASGPLGATGTTGATGATGATGTNSTVGATGTGGLPSNRLGSFSFALAGPAAVGVPNFFIENFQIPPFLLPIYQAAGIEYDVPWQVLAAINEIETDYGRNLSISSAGAVGWMQFLPSTWKTWGVAATGNGIADPYNPVDAIFTAARYLQAAGAAKNIPRAIFAYNHANWYVESVLLRARLIGGIPSQLVGALSGLVQAHFPVAATSTYADDAIQKQAARRLRGVNSGIVTSDASTGTDIYAKQGSSVIAVSDGKILKIGHSKQLGKFIELQDNTGNVFTYSNLGSIPRLYAIPRVTSPSASSLASLLSLPGAAGGAITGPASAGSQVVSKVAKTLSTATQGASALTRRVSATAGSTLNAVTHAKSAAAAVSAVSAIVKERLFAHPEIPAAYAAGGASQVQSAAFAISSFKNYFSDALHLAKNQYTLAPLVKGSIVVAGTIIGRVAANSATQASHLYFQVRPAGKNSPLIDPKPLLDGWKLMQATALYRAKGIDPFFGQGAKNASVGEVLLMSKEQLQERVLSDTHVSLDSCTTRQVQAGDTDRRILAALEFLSVSGLDPTASAADCLTQAGGPNQAAATAGGSTIDLLKINGIPVLGHQGNGSITDITIRRLLTLQSSMAPSQIISLMSYKGQQTTLALPDHNNRIQIAYTPLFGQNAKLDQQISNILKPKQWINLISQIGQIPEPTIPTSPSPYSIRTAG